MADFVTLKEVMFELEMSEAEIEQLIVENYLTPHKNLNGETIFEREQVEALVAAYYPASDEEYTPSPQEKAVLLKAIEDNKAGRPTYSQAEVAMIMDRYFEVLQAATKANYD